jgi:hypothetical protein
MRTTRAGKPFDNLVSRANRYADDR